MLRSAAGLAEAAVGLDKLAGVGAEPRRPRRRGRPPTCSPSAPRSPRPPRCARRPAARTGARTSPTATTRTGRPRRRRSGPTVDDRTFAPARPPTARSTGAASAGIAATPYADLPGDAAPSWPRPASTRDDVQAAIDRGAGRGPARRAGDVTSVATIAADARGDGRLRRPRGRRRGRARRRRAGLRRRRWATTSTVTDRVPDGTRVARRRRGDAGRRPDPRAAHRRAHRPQLRLPPLRRRHRHRRAGSRPSQGTGARVLDTRKTLPGLARAAEVRRALRRRRQPPVQPVRHGDGQGQPRRRRRRRGAGATTRSVAPTPTCRSRWRSPTSTSCGSCSRPAARRSCSTTCPTE